MAARTARTPGDGIGAPLRRQPPVPKFALRPRKPQWRSRLFDVCRCLHYRYAHWFRPGPLTGRYNYHNSFRNYRGECRIKGCMCAKMRLGRRSTSIEIESRLQELGYVEATA